MFKCALDGHFSAMNLNPFFFFFFCLKIQFVRSPGYIIQQIKKCGLRNFRPDQKRQKLDQAFNADLHIECDKDSIGYCLLEITSNGNNSELSKGLNYVGIHN